MTRIQRFPPGQQWQSGRIPRRPASRLRRRHSENQQRGLAQKRIAQHLLQEQRVHGRESRLDQFLRWPQWVRSGLNTFKLAS